MMMIEFARPQTNKTGVDVCLDSGHKQKNEEEEIPVQKIASLMKTMQKNICIQVFIFKTITSNSFNMETLFLRREKGCI
jgi:hypothetical protein